MALHLIDFDCFGRAIVISVTTVLFVRQYVELACVILLSICLFYPLKLFVLGSVELACACVDIHRQLQLVAS